MYLYSFFFCLFFFYRDLKKTFLPASRESLHSMAEKKIYSSYVEKLSEYMVEIADDSESSMMETQKWFMTFHSKEKSIWHIKLFERPESQSLQKQQPFFCRHANSTVQQSFFCGQTLTSRKLYFEFTDYHFQYNGLDVSCSLSEDGICLFGEYVEDCLGNTIFLLEDILCPDLFGSSMHQRYELLHHIVDKMVETIMDPFIVQVKVLYPYENMVLDYFFKTVLLQYNVDLDGIVVMNDFGWQQHKSCHVVPCRNRATLDLKDLDLFLKNVECIHVVENVMDFHTRSNINIAHGTQKRFFTKRDPEKPDIYLLFEDESCSGQHQYASIPSYATSIFMNRQPSEFVMDYTFHEYQQKWIPVFPFCGDMAVDDVQCQ
jgi:hypothetical protein